MKKTTDKYLINKNKIAEYQRTKNQELKTEILKDNMQLVYKSIRPYIGILEQEDLVQEGLIGMSDAIERYDVNGDIQFSTYAVAYIQGYAKRYINYISGLKPIPDKDMEDYQKITEYIMKHSTVNIKEIAEALDMSEVRIRHLMEKENLMKGPKIIVPESIHKKIKNVNEELEYGETLEDKNSEKQFSAIYSSAIKEELKEIILDIIKKTYKASLVDRNYNLFCDYYGFSDFAGKVSCESIGEKYHVSRQNVNKIVMTVINELSSEKRKKEIREKLGVENNIPDNEVLLNVFDFDRD